MRDDNTVLATADEARAAVAEQAQLGYDFIKVYTNLSAEAYEAVLATATEHGLRVAGHVPRFVLIDDALRSGQHSIEHLTDYGDLVESDDSPFRDGFHWSKLYFAMPTDSVKFALAAMQITAAGVWTTPTAVQADRGIAPLETLASWLASPAMAYIGADGRDFWESLATEQLDRMDDADWQLVDQGRANRLAMIAALDAAGANLLVGTDAPNPFVVPGFSLHEELDNFVAAGLAPGRVIQVATRDAARFLGVLDDVGTVEAGKRADLLLLEDNPLDGIAHLGEPAGVMVRGAWLPRDELDRRLEAIRETGGL